MMKGKACTKTLRSCLLTHPVLHCLLLQTTPGNPKRGTGDDTYDEDKDDFLTKLIDEEGADDTRGLQKNVRHPQLTIFHTAESVQ